MRRLCLALLCVPAAGVLPAPAAASVPHTVMPYDMLTLAVLLRTRTEWIVATALAWMSYLAVRIFAWIPPSRNHDASIVAAWPWWLALCYLPALALVLLRRQSAMDRGAASEAAAGQRRSNPWEV